MYLGVTQPAFCVAQAPSALTAQATLHCPPHTPHLKGQWTSSSAESRFQTRETHTATPERNPGHINSACKIQSPLLPQCVLGEPEPTGSAEGAFTFCSSRRLLVWCVLLRHAHHWQACARTPTQKAADSGPEGLGSRVSRFPASASLSPSPQLPEPWHQRYPETSRKLFPAHRGQHWETGLSGCRLHS